MYRHINVWLFPVLVAGWSVARPPLPDRRSVALGAASLIAPPAVRAADVSLGSDGLSSFEALKLREALKELSEAMEVAKATALKPIGDSYLGVFQEVLESQIQAISTSKIQSTGDELLRVAASSGKESYGMEARSIEKSGNALVAACAKKDVGAAAKTATKLATEMTDLAYEWTATEKPLAEITGGTPALKPNAYVPDSEISKTMKRQL